MFVTIYTILYAISCLAVVGSRYLVHLAMYGLNTRTVVLHAPKRLRNLITIIIMFQIASILCWLHFCYLQNITFFEDVYWFIEAAA